jgi:hypothetical protein
MTCSRRFTPSEVFGTSLPHIKLCTTPLPYTHGLTLSKAERWITQNPPFGGFCCVLDFGLFVGSVLAALTAELRKRNFPLHQLLILAGVVVAALTDAAAELYLVLVAL